MSEPVKYLSVVSKVVELYQLELIGLFKRMSLQSQTNIPDLMFFKTKLDK